VGGPTAMKPAPVLLGGVPVVPMPRAELVKSLLHMSRPPFTACAVSYGIYAHCVNRAAREPHYLEALRSADLNYADGMGVVLALRLLGTPNERIEKSTSTDLIHPLAAGWAAEGRRLYLLGGRPGVADAAGRRLEAMYPGLVIAGTDHGFFQDGESPDVISRVGQSGAHVLIVCRGVPVEQLWVAEHRHELPVGLAMTGGALLDFLSGRVRRGPRLMTDHGFDWLFRMAREPRRLAARYLIGNPEFVLRVAWQRMAGQAHRG
jgi:N-acetylglucosaminyldiphosphoundecaprenol N-acetyl-beta-D-mannosaminyltransferase